MNLNYLNQLHNVLNYYHGWDRITSPTNQKQFQQEYEDGNIYSGIHSLKNIKNPPLNLYYKGNLNNFKKNNIAIIGSRKPSVLGSEKAFSTSSFLAKKYGT